MKDKTIGIFLIFCLAVPIAASFIFLTYQKYHLKKVVKKQIIAGVDQKELVLLKLTLSEAQSQLRWEHAMEFEYQGQMYDVVEQIAKGDSIFFRCWWDHKETRLNKQLGELLTIVLGKDPKRKDCQERLLSFYKSLIYSVTPVLDNVYLNTNQLSYYYWLNNYLLFHPPSVPPPK